ncbi:MAG: GIY-YIG nuclease family protein [Candidatus Uhrbacteria bacterium]
MSERQFYVYILTNAARTVLYIGVTNDLVRRVFEHREKFVDGFTKRYHLNRLVYYEVFTTAYDAITREKQLKGWTRKRKLDLIQQMNSSLRDLYPEICS